jgi:hypothetical protein
MFAQSLFVQWKWNRDFLAFYTIVAAAGPLVILWIALPQLGLTSARELVAVGSAVGAAAAAIAVLAGLTLAWQGYGVDDRAGHIYTLSLPVTRGRLLGLRAATASLLLVLPALGVWAGATLAAHQAHLPPTLDSYAGSLAIRAVLASWLAHSCMFALRYGAGRRAKALGAALAIGGSLLGLLALLSPGVRDLMDTLADALISNPGPFGVLFGRWTMIDV